MSAPRKIVYSGEKSKRRGLVGAVLAFFFLATMIVSPVMAGQPPFGNDGPGICHGRNQEPCRPDPQPDHGKDCLPHGRNQDGNDDHCGTPTPTPSPTNSASPSPTFSPEPSNSATPSTPPGSQTPTSRPSSNSGSTLTLPQTDTENVSYASLSGHPASWVLFMLLVTGIVYGAYVIKDSLSRKR